MQKIIFLDVDGTLVNYKGQVPESAVRAVRQARAAGHRIYICTGRSRAEVYPELWDIGFDGMIGGNGSYLEDQGKVVDWQHLSLEQCRRIVDWLYGRGLEFYLECNAGLFASRNFAVGALPAIREYSRRKGKSDAENLTVQSVFPEMIYGAEPYRDDVNKISYVLHTYQDFLDAKEEFADMANGTWGGAGETALFGDVGLAGITKGNGVRKLLRYLGADREDAIAIGDAKVDIPMFEACAVGVAMENGGDEVKAAADFVTGDVDEDGLYHAFVKLGLF